MAHRHRPIRRPVARMAVSSFAAGAMVVGGAGIAQACDNGSQASGTSEAGTVQAINGNVITILDRAGNTDTVDTDNNTMFESGGSTGSESGIANGDFLWAFGSMQSDGSLMASKVKYGPANQSNTRESSASQSDQDQQSSSASPSGDDDDSGSSSSGSQHHSRHHHS